MAKYVKAVNKKASGIAVIFKDLVLLGKRSKTCYLTGDSVAFGGYWSIFGGTIEPNETEKEAASREFFEETKISIDHNKLKFIKKIQNDDCDFSIYAFFSDKILFPNLNKEHTEYGWFKISCLGMINGPIDPKISKAIKKIKV